MLSVRHLTKRFPGVVALDDVSFEVGAGRIHALCGENGAGKSTLIKVLSGVHAYGSYQGSFEVAGRVARFASVRDAAAAGIAVIHQELSVIDELNVAQNLLLGAEPRRWGPWLDGRAAERESAAMLGEFGVALDPLAPVRSLGVAQKQQVEIVRALARDSRLQILDEPTAALAEHEVGVLLRHLLELRARGICIIYISHRLDEVFKLADRVTVLRDGASVCERDAGELDAPTVMRYMVGRDISGLPARQASSPGDAVLAVEGLTVADGGRPRLQGISFELRAGEILGIGGLMGAGRTELLMHLFGAWGQRRAGRVVLAGRVMPSGDPRIMLAGGMALVSEDRRRLGLILGESVGFNLSLSSLGALSRAGFIGAHAEHAANQQWFDALGVKASGLAAVVGRLSGGNQQKVVLGKALMTRPRVLLLDEPTRGIDIGAKLEIHALISRLAAEGCAVLLVSSDLPELIGMSDRITMMRDGALGGTFARERVTPELLMAAALGGGVENTATRI
jgi:D-xylose transport system ATP-binding protein